MNRATAPVGGVPPTLLNLLSEVVGGEHLLVDPEVVGSYTCDWTGRYRGVTSAVVRPATTTEVAEIVSICRSHGLALVPQGGNTGLVGGGVPLHGEVVLSLHRLDRIENVDGVAGQLCVGAGVTVAAAQDAADEAGWRYGVDFASRDSATIGGSVATNAGGLRTLRHGDTRAQLVGIEAVLGNGAVISHLGGLTRDNTGYTLASLLCGSEGTLGVVTTARLRMVPPTPERVVALLAFASIDMAISAAGELRRTEAMLDAVEFFLDEGLELVRSVTGLPTPFPVPHRAYLLVEAAGPVDPTDELAETVATLKGVRDVAVAEDSIRAAELWRYRETHSGAINTLGPPHKLDVALPSMALAEFVTRVTDVVRDVAPRARTWLFGHVAEGSVHVNVTGPAPDNDRVDDVVLRLVAGLGGSISAEHGIGTAKRRWLHLNRSAEELAAFEAIKAALDPDGIMNPHVLLPE